MSFEEKVQKDYYENSLPYGDFKSEERRVYQAEAQKLSEEFELDFRNWLYSQGVPGKYVSKVALKAWEDGHSSGYSEILNCAYSLVDIFKD